MNFLSHTVKTANQFTSILKEGVIRSGSNLVEEGNSTPDSHHDYYGDEHVGYTNHVMCASGLGYLLKGYPAAILFPYHIIKNKTISYIRPYKYEYYLAIAKLLKKESEKGEKDWMSIIDSLPQHQRKGFPPFKTYMSFFFDLKGPLNWKTTSFREAWGPSTYSEMFIRELIPRLSKTELETIKRDLEQITVHGTNIIPLLEKNPSDLGFEILLSHKVNLKDASGFAFTKGETKLIKTIEVAYPDLKKEQIGEFVIFQKK